MSDKPASPSDTDLAREDAVRDSRVDASREQFHAELPPRSEARPERDGTIFDYAIGSEFGLVDGVKPGRPADHPLGVLYQGPWEVPGDGFNTHVRRCARALATTSCPVQLKAIDPEVWGGEPHELPEDVADLLRTTVTRYSVKILQLVPALGAVHRVTQPVLLGRQLLSHAELRQQNYFRVLSIVIERDRVSSELADALARVGQVWVACEANQRTLQRAGVADVRVVPVPYLQNDPLRATKEGKPQRPPRFYHIGKWEPRKAQDQIVHAFLRAFQPGEAHLVLKTRPLRTAIEGYPQGPEQALALALQDPAVQHAGWSEQNAGKYVQVVSGMLTAQQMLTLHRSCDVYVTLSRGEGFDMPAFDAKLAGNVMVYTPSGGPQDFATPGDVRVEPNGSVPRHAFYTDWEPDARYLDFDLNAATGALRKASAQFYLGEHGAPPPPERFSAEAVGKAMLGHLQALIDAVGGGPVFQRGGPTNG